MKQGNSAAKIVKLLEKVEELRQKDIAGAWLPTPVELPEWTGDLAINSFRLPADMTDFIEAISDVTKLKRAPIVRLAIDLGLDAIYRDMPPEVRKQIDSPQLKKET